MYLKYKVYVIVIDDDGGEERDVTYREALNSWSRNDDLVIDIEGGTFKIS